MWIVYVPEVWTQYDSPYGPATKISQFAMHSKHETEAEAEAVALELERLGYDCWIEQAGQSSDRQYGVTIPEGVNYGS